MSQVQEPARENAPVKGRKHGKKNAGAKNTTNPPMTPGSPEAPASPGDDEKGDLVTEFWLRFGRFGWDVLGVGLIAFSLVTLIGFINQNQTGGILLSWWIPLSAKGFGWGWPLLVIAFGLLGLFCLRKRFTSSSSIPIGRILALEGLAFCLLTLLSIFGGISLDNAEMGQDGGVIGWGLAVLLNGVMPAPWGTIFLILLMALFAGYGTGLLHWSVRRLERWLSAAVPVSESASLPSAVETGSQGASATNTSAEEENADQDEIPDQPLVRDPGLPPLTLLLDEQNVRPEESYIQETALNIEHTLGEFGVPARVVGYRVGPTVTQYAVEPGFIERPGPDGEPVRQKVRVSQISALSRDLALALSAERLRIEAPVPGRSYVGVEVPNQLNAVVRMRPLLESEPFKKLTSPLAVVLGKDVSGQPVVADLGRMPHLLIAGTTGSGKSICISAIATCLVVNNQPSELRLAMLDPKMVELVRFNGLPHLFGRVETQVDRMLGVLRWAIMEMEHRYKLLEDAHTRDIETYNRRAVKHNQPKLPRIVVIIDELADLMMTAPDQTEHSLIRLAQMARATGIHLVVATQRPSTDVVTGLIKANFPARLAFTVASSVDSRVILDGSGAETLLGKGDMLFLNPESGTPLRAQGVLVSEEEVDGILNFWKEKMAADPAAMGAGDAAPWEELLEAGEEDGDKLVEQAVKIVRMTQRASTSLLQRRLRIGYPRAARLMDELEELGVVGPSQGGGREREVLLLPEEGEAPEFDESGNDD